MRRWTFLLLLATHLGASAQDADVPANPPAAAASAAQGESQADRARHAAMLAEGVRVLRAGNPRQAIEQFDAVIAEYEASARGSARFVFSSRWPVETLSYLLEVANNQKTAPGGAAVFGPSWGDAYYLKAFAFVELKQPSDARAALERAIALAPRNSQYRSELGNLQLAEKNWTDALETFRTAEAAARAVSPPAIKNSDLTRALRGQGYAMVELGRLEEAEKLYLQCLEIDPKDARAAGELKYLRQRRAAAPTAS